MVSAKRPASSIPAKEVRISGGIFLFSLTYWSNWAKTVRIKACISMSLSDSGMSSALAAKHSSISIKPLTLARCTPSTKTFTVPSGNLSICKTVATVPTSYKSSASGSSLLADFCATNKICLLPSDAISKALTDFVRPTNKGITRCGYTTTSRNGKTGNKPSSEE